MNKPKDLQPAKKSGRPKFGGRKPGSPNRVSTSFREVVIGLLESNKDNFDIWLQQVAEKDPYKALMALTTLAEYAAPKLGRIEHVGDAGGAIETVTRIELGVLTGSSVKKVESESKPVIEAQFIEREKSGDRPD